MRDGLRVESRFCLFYFDNHGKFDIHPFFFRMKWIKDDQWNLFTDKFMNSWTNDWTVDTILNEICDETIKSKLMQNKFVQMNCYQAFHNNDFSMDFVRKIFSKTTLIYCFSIYHIHSELWCAFDKLLQHEKSFGKSFYLFFFSFFGLFMKIKIACSP